MPVIVLVILILAVVMTAFALIALKLVKSLRSMEIQIGFGAVLPRYKSPLLFWVAIALQCLGLVALLAIIYFIFFVLPNQVQVMS